MHSRVWLGYRVAVVLVGGRFRCITVCGRGFGYEAQCGMEEGRTPTLEAGVTYTKRSVDIDLMEVDAMALLFHKLGAIVSTYPYPEFGIKPTEPCIVETRHFFVSYKRLGSSHLTRYFR